MQRIRGKTFALAAVLLVLVAGAVADNERHAWQVPAPRLASEAYFTNVKDGDRIETPFLLKFGLSGGWGLAPIASVVGGKSGHHHLLVNRDLPLDFKKPLPFDEQYIHFGKGQMETVLSLAPGTYTLRLLLADEKHLPRFVYSKPATVTVTRKSEVDPKSLPKKGISIGLASAVTATPFRVQFHASALNIAHQAQKEKDTGHFRLSVLGKGKSAEFDLVDGQTELWLAPPTGDYTLKLELVDNLNPGRSLAPSVATAVSVQ